MTETEAEHRADLLLDLPDVLRAQRDACRRILKDDIEATDETHDLRVLLARVLWPDVTVHTPTDLSSGAVSCAVNGETFTLQ